MADRRPSSRDRPRCVLHVDMDAFYASVEQRDDPSLAGRPVLVGGRPPRGVVAAASYESRRYGIRSAMPMREALSRCPGAVVMRPRMSHYQAVSRQVFDILRRLTPDVEGLSLDEAYLDLTASPAHSRDPAEEAERPPRSRAEADGDDGVRPAARPEEVSYQVWRLAEYQDASFYQAVRWLEHSHDVNNIV